MVMTSSSIGGTGATVLGLDGELTVFARGFDATGATVYLDGGEEPLNTSFLEDNSGQLAAQITLPPTLTFGRHELEVRQQNEVVATTDFVKALLDERMREEAPRPEEIRQQGLEERMRQLVCQAQPTMNGCDGDDQGTLF